MWDEREEELFACGTKYASVIRKSPGVLEELISREEAMAWGMRERTERHRGRMDPDEVALFIQNYN